MLIIRSDIRDTELTQNDLISIHKRWKFGEIIKDILVKDYHEKEIMLYYEKEKNYDFEPELIGIYLWHDEMINSEEYLNCNYYFRKQRPEAFKLSYLKYMNETSKSVLLFLRRKISQIR